MGAIVRLDHFFKRRPVEILLVEDNANDAGLLREALRRSRFPIRLTVIPDGEEALHYLHRQPPHLAAPRPDLLLLDLDLPRRNGYEVVEEVRRSSRLGGIPILVFTGSELDEDKWKACLFHLDAYLIKPKVWAQYGMLVKYLEENWMEALRLDQPPGG